MGERMLSKINAVQKLLYRQKSYLNFSSRKLLVNSLLLPHFDYAAISFFSSMNQSLKTKLQTAQNKAIRFIFNSGPRVSIDKEHFKRLKWLPIEKRNKFSTLVLTFKCLNDNAPQYMVDKLQKTSSRHSHNTRSHKYSLIIPKTGTNGQRAFSYLATKYWNELPQNIQSSNSLAVFKFRLKQYFYELL